MISGRGYHRTPEITIEWAGFQASAWDLERCGWRFEEMLDGPDPRHPFGRDKTVVMRHEGVGWTGIAKCPIEETMYAINQQLNMRSECKPVFRVTRMGNRSDQIILDRSYSMSAQNFRALDFEPAIREETYRMRLSDILPQRCVEEEIIVEPDTVMGLLDQIKKLQAPDLARIREENRRRDARDQADRPREIRHATILSLAA